MDFLTLCVIRGTFNYSRASCWAWDTYKTVFCQGLDQVRVEFNGKS